MDPNLVVLGGSATATPNATDATSGIDSQSCGPVVTTTIGTRTVTCSATDVAGNTATATANYTVGAFIGSFISPLPKSTLAKATSSIPVKCTLRDADGPLSSTASAPLAANHQVEAVLSGPRATGPDVVIAPCTWNATGLYFQCTIKTPKTLQTKVAHFITAKESAVGGTFFTVPGTGNPETISFK